MRLEVRAPGRQPETPDADDAPRPAVVAPGRRDVLEYGRHGLRSAAGQVVGSPLTTGAVTGCHPQLELSIWRAMTTSIHGREPAYPQLWTPLWIR